MRWTNARKKLKQSAGERIGKTQGAKKKERTPDTGHSIRSVNNDEGNAQGNRGKVQLEQQREKQDEVWTKQYKN